MSADKVANLFCFGLDATFLAYKVEKRALSTYPLPLPFWKRYVDDTLAVLPQDKVQHFHQHT